MTQEIDLILAGCLRRLLKSRFILKSRSETWYGHILDRRKRIDDFLEGMAAKLIINDGLGVIYLHELDPEIEEKISFQLGSRMTLRKLSTHVLLIMRKKRDDYYRNPDSSAACFVRKQELKELLLPFLEKIERYKEDKKIEIDLKDALRELRELQVVFETAEGSEVFEISPVCEILLPFEDINKLEMSIRSYMESVATMEGYA